MWPNFGAPPVAKLRPHGVALAKFIAPRVAWNGLKDKFGQGGVELDVGIFASRFRVACFGPICSRCESIKLIDQWRTRRTKTADNDDGRHHLQHVPT